MPICPRCLSEIPAGTRWCTLCQASVTGSPEKLAPPLRRLGAFALDTSIPFLALSSILGSPGVRENRSLAVTLLAGYAFFAIALFAQGTTPGKKALGMRVIRENGGKPGLPAMMLREWIGKSISGAFFLLGYLWILFDRERQGWHDKLANTYVVQ